MRRTAAVFLFTFICVFSATKSFKLSDKLQICARGNDDCLKTAIENAIRLMAENGLPELKIPKFDPIQIPEMSIEAKGGAVDIVQKYNDVKLYGYRNAVVPKAHMDWDKKLLTFVTVSPAYEQISDYDIKGKILVFPVYGNGKANITQVDCSITHNIQFEEITKNGKTYLQIKSYNIDMQPKRMIFQYGNLFNGNTMLSDRIHSVVNENWDTMWSDTKKDFEEIYSRVYKGYAQALFNKTPLQDIFN